MAIPRVLETRPLDLVDALATPDERKDVTLESSALEIFTDFKKHRPLVIDASVAVAEAEQLMRRAHVKLKLVVDPAGGFLGTVSFRDLYGERFKQLLGQGTPQPDILVKNVMTPRAELRAISYDQLAKATIADIVETLQSEHCQHFLVVDVDTHEICGVLSASDIARRLHVAIDITTSPVFADICHTVSTHVQRARSIG